MSRVIVDETTKFDPTVFKQLMKKSHMGITETAQALNITQKTLRMYLDGQTQPSLGAVIRMSDFYAVPIDVLLGRCTQEQFDNVISNYEESFMTLRRMSFEKYLCAIHKKSEKNHFHNCKQKNELPYPYNLISAIRGDEPIDFPLNQNNINALNDALAGLYEREELVLKKHYKQGLSLAEIAEFYNVTRERIRQIIKSALRKLGQPETLTPILKRFHSFEEIDKYAKEQMTLIDKKQQALKQLITSASNEITSCPKPEPSVLSAMMDVPITNLPLSVRAFNRLKQNDIKTMGAILMKLNDDPASLYKLRNMGQKTYDDILIMLDKTLNTKNYYQTIYSPKRIKDLNELKKEMKQINRQRNIKIDQILPDYELSINESIEILKLPPNIHNCLIDAGFNTIGDVIATMSVESAKIATLPNMDIKSYEILCKALDDTLGSTYYQTIY